MGQKCYCCQVDLTELKLKWSIENLKTHKKEDMKKFNSAWIFKQKNGNIAHETLNAEIDTSQTFKYRGLNFSVVTCLTWRSLGILT